MFLDWRGLPLFRAGWSSLLAPLDSFVQEEKLHFVVSENVVPELHQESPLWESMKDHVGICGAAAAGLTVVATV